MRRGRTTGRVAAVGSIAVRSSSSLPSSGESQNDDDAPNQEQDTEIVGAKIGGVLNELLDPQNFLSYP